MRLGKDLEGKPIISAADGRILGRAKDVYVDPEINKLMGLFTGMEGVIRRRSQVIPSDDVVLYGIDVILVKDAEVIVNDKKLPEVKKPIPIPIQSKKSPKFSKDSSVLSLFNFDFLEDQ